MLVSITSDFVAVGFNDELGRIWKESVVLQSRYNSFMFLEGMRRMCESG
jgi:hypothetical protein